MKMRTIAELVKEARRSLAVVTHPWEADRITADFKVRVASLLFNTPTDEERTMLLWDALSSLGGSGLGEIPEFCDESVTDYELLRQAYRWVTRSTVGIVGGGAGRSRRS